MRWSSFRNHYHRYKSFQSAPALRACQSRPWCPSSLVGLVGSLAISGCELGLISGFGGSAHLLAAIPLSVFESSSSACCEVDFDRSFLLMVRLGLLAQIFIKSQRYFAQIARFNYPFIFSPFYLYDSSCLRGFGVLGK